MCKPYDIAKDIWGDELPLIMDFCAEHGTIHSDNDVFLCAYATNSSLIKKNYKNVLDIADTWYVYIAIGNTKRAFELIKPKKFLAYRRFDNRFRLLNFERFRRLTWATKVDGE